MNTDQQEKLILEASLAYIDLMGQLDHLFATCSFYLDRYPSDGSKRDRLISTQLDSCAKELAQLSNEMAAVIKRWKHREDRLLSRAGVETFILNEFWSNITGLVFFLILQDISLDPFNQSKAKEAFDSLCRVNRAIK